MIASTIKDLNQRTISGYVEKNNKKASRNAEKIYMQIYIVQLVQERKIYRKEFFLSGFTTFRYQRRIKLS